MKKNNVRKNKGIAKVNTDMEFMVLLKKIGKKAEIPAVNKDIFLFCVMFLEIR